MAPHGQPPSPFGHWQRGTALALWAGLAVIAVVLAWRRLAGAFAADLTALAACAFSTLAAVLAVAAWGLDARAGSPGSPVWSASTRTRRIGRVAATLLPPIVVGVALCPPQSSATAAFLTVLLLASAAAAWALSQGAPDLAGHQRAASSGETLRFAPTPGSGVNRATAETAASDAELLLCDSPAGASDTLYESNGSQHPAGTLRQWVRRHTLPDGSEQIEGGARASFAAGQKHATIHLAFTPPLAGVPAVECEPLDAADVELNVAAAYSYGVRIEARRAGPAAEPLDVEIGYIVRTAPATSVESARTNVDTARKM
ncbi:MAG TPA: hypothetical protein VML55_19960 [Planctomycetaceae bacterium]|nr:hypothetical protein [Planctomycetaceae bacterium]